MGLGSRREAWSGDRRRRWKIRDSSVDDLDLSESLSVSGGSPDDGVKIKVLDESRRESGTGRSSTRARHRQNIYILKVTSDKSLESSINFSNSNQSFIREYSFIQRSPVTKEDNDPFK